MKLTPAGLGADKKKITLLAILAVAIGVSFWANRSSDSPAAASSSPSGSSGSALVPASEPSVFTAPTTPRTSSTGSAASPVSILRSRAGGPGQRAAGQRGAVRETEAFRPTLKPKDGVDVTSIDPTLHLAMLEKLRDLPMEGGARSLFKESAPPPPPAPPPVKIAVGPKLADIEKPKPADAPKSTTPSEPPPTPIPLKFYGYANQSKGGVKEAFFLDGEDIRIAGENDVIRNRYKIVKIGVNSAVVEDTTDKHQQTLPLVPELS